MVKPYTQEDAERDRLGDRASVVGPFPDRLMLANGVSWFWANTGWTNVNVCPGCLQVRSVVVGGHSRGVSGPRGMCLRCGLKLFDDPLITGVVARFVNDPGQWWPWWTCRGKWEVSRQTMPLILEHKCGPKGLDAALAVARVTRFGRSLNPKQPEVK